MVHCNIKRYLVTSMSIGFSVLGLAATPLSQAAANLDSTFGNNGVALTPASSTNNPHSGSDVAIQAVGKIVTLNGGQLARYNANGTQDASFVTPVNATSSKLAVQTDGKIVTTGSALSRYNSNGSLDATFGTGGQVSVADTVQLAFQSDGKIVVTKVNYSSTDYRGVPYYSNELARYNSNGTLDSTFGVSGIVNYGLTAYSGLLRLTVQADNKILIGSAGEGGRDDNGVTVTRYDANGILDSSFGSNGSARISYTPPITSLNIQCLFYNGYLALANILVQADGKIVVVGNSGQCDRKNVSHNAFSLARFNSNGSLDSTFGSGGKVVIVNSNATGRAFYDAALQADGKIVAVGYIFDPKRFADDFTIMRFSTVGGVDNTLTGITKIGLYSDAYGVAIQGDGKAVVIGPATALDNTQNSALVRYLP